MILGTTLNKEIDNELNRYVTLIDPGLNQFEVVVDKYDGKMYFSHGIEELNKAYKLEHGVWISLIYAFPQLFVIRVHDRHNYEIHLDLSRSTTLLLIPTYATVLNLVSPNG